MKLSMDWAQGCRRKRWLLVQGVGKQTEGMEVDATRKAIIARFGSFTTATPVGMCIVADY